MVQIEATADLKTQPWRCTGSLFTRMLHRVPAHQVPSSALSAMQDFSNKKFYQQKTFQPNSCFCWKFFLLEFFFEKFTAYVVSAQ